MNHIKSWKWSTCDNELLFIYLYIYIVIYNNSMYYENESHLTMNKSDESHVTMHESKIKIN